MHDVLLGALVGLLLLFITMLLLLSFTHGEVVESTTGIVVEEE